MKIDGEKSAAELERERVAAANPENNDDSDTGSDADNGAGNDDDNKDDDNKEDEGNADDENGDDEENDDEDDNEEGDEKEKENRKLKRTVDRLTRRLNKVVGEREATKAELAAARKSLEAKGEDGEKFTKEQVEEEARKLAQQTVAQKEFEKVCDNLNDAAVKVDKDFNKKINEMAEEIGPIPTNMVHILDDLENGGAVLAHLANNVDEAEDIYKLTPGKMASKLAKLSEKLIAEGKKRKPISKVPDPNNRLNGRSSGSNLNLNDNMTDAEWMEQRNKQVSERRSRR